MLLLSISELKAQTDFRPGYVITNTNDTLRGLIDYRGAVRNSKRCDFKESQESAVKEYLPGDIKAYRYIDSKFYVSKKTGEDNWLFLEFVLNGIADLYYYFDGENTHYYIEKTDGKMFELTNEEEHFTQNGRQYVRESKSYLGYLRYAFSDCPQIMPMLGGTAFDMKSLTNITKKYHDYMCDGEKCIIYEKKSTGMKFSLLPFVSMNSSSLSFDGIEKYLAVYGIVNFNSAVYPSIGLKIKATLPRASEKLTLQFSGEYGKSYFYGSGDGTGPNSTYFEEVQVHLSSLKGKAGIKYTYPKGKVRPTAMIGGNILYLMNKDVKRIEDRIENKTVYLNKFNDDIFPTHLLSGLTFEVGTDYHLSDNLVPFLNIGYDRSRAVKKTPLGPYKIIIQTIHIDAGINF